MKTSTGILLAIIIGCLGFSGATYGDVYFNVSHNTGTGVEVYTVGDGDDVGYTAQSGYATAPASELWCAFLSPDSSEEDPIAGTADVRAIVDSTYSTGSYYIGYFPGSVYGGDAWLSIN